MPSSSKSIPYGFQWVDENDIAAVEQVLGSDFLTTGPKVAEFENALCSYAGAKHGVAVCNGTAALDIAVAALDLPPGSEIVTTPFTFVASANCILYNGCVPVFADIDKKTYNLDPEAVRRKITKKTKAIITVDYAGQPGALKEIREIAEKHDLFIIEDACHSLGAEYKGRRIGSFADTTVFSFHPVKHITTGEGGAVMTENEEIYAKLKLLRNHGIDKTPSERAGYAYDMKVLGRNYRITDFQCALGLSQLKKMDRFLKRREEIARYYSDELGAVPGVTVPFVKPDVRHAWHLYPILVAKGRDAFFERMRAYGIGVNVHYIPVYKFTYYSRFGVSPAAFPNTEEVAARVVSLPMFPKLTDSDAARVVEAVKKSQVR